MKITNTTKEFIELDYGIAIKKSAITQIMKWDKPNKHFIFLTTETTPISTLLYNNEFDKIFVLNYEHSKLRDCIYRNLIR